MHCTYFSVERAIDDFNCMLLYKYNCSWYRYKEFLHSLHVYLVSISNAFIFYFFMFCKSHYFDFHSFHHWHYGPSSKHLGSIVISWPWYSEPLTSYGLGLDWFFTLISVCYSVLKGYGMMAVEEWTLNDRGEVESKNPSRYRVPDVGNLPRDFNVTLLSDSPNKQAIVYSSKVVSFNRINSYFCYKSRCLSHHVLI